MINPDPNLKWPLPYEAVLMMAADEQGPTGGCALQAYRCPAGVWTIGWGETDGVRPGDVCTLQQADRWLLEDLTDRAAAVREMCTREPSPHELAAMVSLAYNVGLAGLRGSTVLRQHNAGNAQAAARAFGLWNKARVGGQLVELRGLTARRAREAALYLTPDADGQPQTPQAVEAESSLARSPIAQAGAVIVGAPVVELATQASEGVGALKPAVTAIRGLMVETLGVPPDWALPALAIVVGLIVLRWRLKQRAEGYA
jgi:lysozyme